MFKLATLPAPLCLNGAPDSAHPFCCLNGATNPSCTLNIEADRTLTIRDQIVIDRNDIRNVVTRPESWAVRNQYINQEQKEGDQQLIIDLWPLIKDLLGDTDPSLGPVKIIEHINIKHDFE